MAMFEIKENFQGKKIGCEFGIKKYGICQQLSLSIQNKAREIFQK